MARTVTHRAYLQNRPPTIPASYRPLQCKRAREGRATPHPGTLGPTPRTQEDKLADAFSMASASAADMKKIAATPPSSNATPSPNPLL
jgi:hypothetical protein